jgi:hypothetical protein
MQTEEGTEGRTAFFSTMYTRMKNYYFVNRFLISTFAVFWMLYSFLGVVHRRLNFMLSECYILSFGWFSGIWILCFLIVIFFLLVYSPACDFYVFSTLYFSFACFPGVWILFVLNVVFFLLGASLASEFYVFWMLFSFFGWFPGVWILCVLNVVFFLLRVSSASEFHLFCMLSFFFLGASPASEFYVFWMLFSFFCVFPRRLNFMCSECCFLSFGCFPGVWILFVLNVVFFLLGGSLASEFYMPTFRNTLSVPSPQAL